MIDLKQFVQAIHDAILLANSSLMDKNLELFDTYFDKKFADFNIPNDTNKYFPKMVVLDYPQPMVESSGNTFTQTQIQVPLITLIPLNMSQIEKAVIRAQFEMDIVNDQLQLNFVNKANRGTGIFGNKKEENDHHCEIEITISPQEMPEGLKIVVNGYDAMLKRQIM